jgi:hypothetical protein
MKHSHYVDVVISFDQVSDSIVTVEKYSNFA